MAFSDSLGTRTTAVVTSVATALAAITVPATLSPAFANSPATASDLSATKGFLERQISQGAGDNFAYILPGAVPGYTDVGMTMDYLLALDALGGDKDLIGKSFKAILEPKALDPYLKTVDSNTNVTTIETNRLSMLLYTAKKLGVESDQLNQLGDQLSKSIDNNGRAHEYNSDGTLGASLHNYGQSWFILAAKLLGKEDLAKKAAANLEAQICSDGGVPLFYKTTPDCDNVDPDSTGLAAQAFAFTLGSNDTATTSAVNYLRNAQKDDGGFPTRMMAGSPETSNANTTALAAGAFVAVGDTQRFAKAHYYLDSVRFGSTANKSVQGAFAYSAKTASADTITDQLRRATGQSALAYAGHNYIGSEPITNFASYSPTPTNPNPQPDPQPQPDQRDNASSGDSTVGIALGIIAAVVAVIAAIAAAMNIQMPRGL